MKPKRSNEPQPSGLTRVAKLYAENLPLRLMIQKVPIVGGAIDTMFSGLAADWKAERLESFVRVLDRRLRRIEGFERLPEVRPSEPLYDFVMQVFDHVIRTRSDEKRRRFANIVARQVEERVSWEEAEAAGRLLNDLSDAHVDVLCEALRANICDKHFEGLRVVALSGCTEAEKESGTRPTRLQKVFPELSAIYLRMICSELAARGLLRDEGVGRISTKAMVYFVATDLAQWFIDWIGRESSTGPTGAEQSTTEQQVR